MRFAVQCHRVFVVALLAAAFDLAAANLVDIPQLGLRVARGFRVTLFSDANLANDIYAMTIDPRGDVVVTSQGYIRTLLDRNGDGGADGPPTKLFSIEFGEHGGHAPRRGPDGWWYFIGGNDSKFSGVQVDL